MTVADIIYDPTALEYGYTPDRSHGDYTSLAQPWEVADFPLDEIFYTAEPPSWLSDLPRISRGVQRSLPLEFSQ